MPAVAVLASRVRVEEKAILETLERRGVSCVQVDPRRLHVTLAGAAPSYDVAVSRELSHSRAVTGALLLEGMGVRTLNSAAVITTCGDKLLTSLALVRAGVPTPRTSVALAAEAATDAAEALGYPVVVKPMVGSWGRLAAIARDAETLTTIVEHRAALPSPQQHLVYLQELVDKPDRDIRVIVVGDRVLGATYRISRDDWRTNVARDAVTEVCPVTDELEALCLAAARAVGGGVLGVDVVEDREGRLLVLEVNHTVEFRGFQTAHADDLDVAGAIVEHVLEGQEAAA